MAISVFHKKRLGGELKLPFLLTNLFQRATIFQAKARCLVTIFGQFVSYFVNIVKM